jgi:hypothetical protein
MGSRRGSVRYPAEVARHLLAASQADREPPRATRARWSARCATGANAASRRCPSGGGPWGVEPLWSRYRSRPAGKRQRLGFTGVTITDALEAGALQSFGTIGQRATLAAQAGMDLILCSAQQTTEGDQAKIALENGYQDGTLGHAAFQAALQRVLALKSSLVK